MLSVLRAVFLKIDKKSRCIYRDMPIFKYALPTKLVDFESQENMMRKTFFWVALSFVIVGAIALLLQPYINVSP